MLFPTVTFALLDVVLPVGISFFTFQAMSYTIDVHRKVIPPAASHLDFALYLAFFPQLVAGPIVRAGTLPPQIERPLATCAPRRWIEARVAALDERR